MAEPLKNQFDEVVVRRIGAMLRSAHAAFPPPAPEADAPRAWQASRRELEIRPVVVERVRPFRWAEGHAAAPARPLPAVEAANEAPRPLSRRRRRATLALGGVAIAVAPAALAAFLTGHTSSALCDFRRVTFLRGMVDGARFGPDGGIVYSAQWDGTPSELFLGTAAVADARRVLPGSSSPFCPRARCWCASTAKPDP